MRLIVHSLAKKIRAQLKIAATRQLTERLEWLKPYPIGFRVKALLAIQDDNWSALARHASDYRRNAMRDLVRVSVQRQAWVNLSSDVDRLCSAARQSGNWIRPDRRSDWQQVRAGVISVLQKRGFSEAQVKRGAKDAALTTLDDLLKVVTSPLDTWAAQLEMAVIPRLSSLAAADLAAAVAQFNLKGLGRRKLSAPKPSEIHRASLSIQRQLKQLYVSIRNGRPNTIEAKARQLRSTATKNLVSLVEAAVHLAPTGSNNTVASGREALSAADALRLSIFAISASRLVEWSSGWPAESSFFQEWSRAANSKEFSSAYRAPKTVRVSDVARAPARFDGKSISLEGRIGPVVIIHRGSKVISATSISDSKGAVVAVGISHIKLDSGGLVSDSYSLITGTFKASSKEFPGPCLVLDRRNLTTDSQTSWLDWLTLQMLPVLTVSPHNLCVTSSWKLGKDGPGNPLRYGVWSTNRRRVL